MVASFKWRSFLSASEQCISRPPFLDGSVFCDIWGASLLLDASEAAFEQNDYGRMAQLSETTRPKVVRGLTYGDLHPSKSTAILARSCIGLLRIRKELYYMLAGLIIISWLLIKTSVFSSLPLMEVSETRKLLGSLCITMAFNAFNQFQISQAADICTKRLKGLSLPVSDFHVRIGYLLTTLLFTALVCLPVIHRCKSYGRWMVDVEKFIDDLSDF